MKTTCDWNNHLMCIEPVCTCECHDEDLELVIDEQVAAWAGWLDVNLP